MTPRRSAPLRVAIIGSGFSGLCLAIQLKRADLSFRFALEIRNKLIDAYREVMRMNV